MVDTRVTAGHDRQESLVLVMQPSVDPLDDRPLYKQVADQLRDQLDGGDIGPGERLPSESDLMRTFDVSRSTARRGLAEIINEGLAVARPGMGVFARARGPARRLIIDDPADPERGLTAFRTAKALQDGTRKPMQYAAEQQGFEYEQEVLSFGEVRASPKVAGLLDVEPGEPVFARRRRVLIRWQGRGERWRPSKLANSYLPIDLAIDDIRQEDTGPGGLYARLEEHGHRLTRFEESIEFRMPLPHELRLLRLAAGVPIFDQTRVAFSGDRPVECFLAALAGDLHELQYRINAERSPA